MSALAYPVPIHLPRRRRIISPGEWLKDKVEEQRRERESTIAEAVAVVQSSQTAGGANNNVGTLGVGATAGNLLVTFFSQSLATTPSCATGFTVNATDGLLNASADSVWVGYKIASGGETTATWTAGSGGTAHGVCIWELSGAANPFSLDFTPPVHTDNISSTTGSLTVTTTVAGSIILIGVGGNTASGTINAWTGTNVATNISTATSRCFGGSFITTSTVSSSFTANWTTSRVCSMLAIAFKPAVAGKTPSIISGFMGRW